MKSDERGQAMIEAAIVFPLIVGLTIIVVDVGSILLDYLALTRVAYEGSRYAAGEAGLNEVLSGPGADDAGCYYQNQTEDGAPAPDLRCVGPVGKHSELHERVLKLFEVSERQLKDQHAKITTEYYGDTSVNDLGSAMGLPPGMVRVTIDYYPRTFFLDRRDFSIRVNSIAPYLFPGES